MKKKYYPILMIISCSGMAAAAIGLAANCSGLFIASVAEALGVGRGDVSIYLTISSLTTAFFNPVAVKLVGRIPLRKAQRIAAPLYALCYASISMVKAVWQLYAIGVVIGLCNAFISGVMIPMVIGKWFRTGMGKSLGLAMCFSGIAGAIFNPLLGTIIVNQGWRAAYCWMAFFILLFMVPAMIWSSTDPAEYGMTPVGGDIPETAPVKTAAEQQDSTVRMTAAASVIVILLFTMVQFMSASGTTFGSFHFAGFGTSTGLSLQMAATLSTALMVGNLLSKLVIGVMIDKIGANRSAQIYMLFIAAAAAMLALFNHLGYGFMMVCAVFFGMTYAVSTVALAPMMRDVFGKDFAQKQSYVALISGLFNGAITSLIGYIYDWSGSYTPALLMIACFQIIGILLIFIIFKKFKPRTA